ncbi:DUF2851 family protein [Chryseobacterium sp.]|uniref:DUF2851 family protein n=1 Tax=Chryseobacterium sp. TaxID=1871047 RepID=UPI0028A076E6|nr:DUF2851 family protein [Chryseobacterium sp.]
MTEKLLQYLWNFKIFNNLNFKDTEGNPIEILDFGRWNKDSGPDFLMAKIKIGNLIHAGNIELHIRSSDWIFHQHSLDSAFDNIILHVVFQDDAEIPGFKEKQIPTLELRHHIDENLLRKYDQLIHDNSFIACENLFEPSKIPFQFHEENILKKLYEKSVSIEEDLEKSKNNFEAILFHQIAYAFGLKVNAHIFKQIAESIDFTTFNKIRQNKTQLEALFFGISDWLENPSDKQTKIWKREFDFLQSKFNLANIKIQPKFLRLRPPNFPTLRLSQLADLYSKHQNIFSKVISAKNSEEIITLFKDITASEYWDEHFNFGKISKVKQEKILSKDFIELITLNAILPVKFTYHKYHHEEISEEMICFYQSLSPEKNTITEGWKKLKVKIENALESQSLIYHFKHFCETKNCLNCGIGFKILKER